MKTSDGKLFVIGGASRSGKTAWTKKRVWKLKRVIVWDVEDQWSKIKGFQRITSNAELVRLCSAVNGPLKIAFVAGGDLSKAFDLWAGCVFYWGRYCGPCVAVAEELADVSTPAKAPGNWGMLIRRGLKRGITIYAISQRWAEADKTALGNASRFVIFRVVGKDNKYMAERSGVPVDTITGLKPLHFVLVDAESGAISKVQKLKF